MSAISAVNVPPPITQFTRSDFVRLDTENRILQRRTATLQELCEHHKSKYEQTVARFKHDWIKKEAEFALRINQLEQQLINQRLKLNGYETKLKSHKHQILQRDISHHKKVKFIDTKIKHYLADIRALRQENKLKDQEIESLKQELLAKDMKILVLSSRLGPSPLPDAISKGNPTPSVIKIGIPDSDSFPETHEHHIRSSTEHSYTNVSAKIYPYLEMASPNVSLKSGKSSNASNPSRRKKRRARMVEFEKKESNDMMVSMEIDTMIVEEGSSDSEEEPPLPAVHRQHGRYRSNASMHSVVSLAGSASVQPLYSQVNLHRRMYSRSNITEFTQGTLSPIETQSSKSPTPASYPFIKESITPELENVDADEPMLSRHIQKATL